jgi:hypothetical protein
MPLGPTPMSDEGMTGRPSAGIGAKEEMEAIKSALGMGTGPSSEKAE